MHKEQELNERRWLVHDIRFQIIYIHRLDFFFLSIEGKWEKHNSFLKGETEDLRKTNGDVWAGSREIRVKIEMASGLESLSLRILEGRVHGREGKKKIKTDGESLLAKKWQ